ncbi:MULTISPECIES: hypothetical protein [Streptomyces]|uniref:RiboL-PSP-HEPN domain-containing protein n=1 Tax=Streptomyces canarius TaxID=285453 RepID=A0ABQ3CLD9_9ACTN|nr:hypothetical protein [Streptomyces canarius]GHA19463.1 hypothetical protein GCM10010345_25110 [Streptomyces canarius]
MSEWEAVSSLEENVIAVARELSIMRNDGTISPDPIELTDEYFDNVRIRVRAFLILCSSELEEFIETQCLEYLARWAREDDSSMQHRCLHALTIYFRRNIGNLLERKGHFVDFYASSTQLKKLQLNDKKARRGEVGALDESFIPILNRRTLIGHVSNWYRDEVVGASHGISDTDLCRLLEPLGFSKALIKEECSTLVAALGSLAAGRGEAAHRSTTAGKYPFQSLPSPLYQQMSVSDAWERWVAVKESLPELRDLLDRKTVGVDI